MGAKRTKSGIIAAAALSGAALTSGAAQAETGWRINASASESISLTDDRISSLTSVRISALSETDRMRFGINTGFGLAVGSGGGLNAVLPSLGVNFGVDGKRMSINSSASLRFNAITFDDDESAIDLTSSEETGIRRSLGASIRGNYDISPRMTGSLGYSYSGISYSETSTSLVPSNTHNINGSISFDAAKDTAVVASIGARWFDADNVRNSESFTLDSSVRVSYDATSRVSFDASAGITWARSQDDILGLRVVTKSTAFLINGGVSYGLPDGTLRLGLSQRIAPEASSGELTRFNTLNLGYTHALNNTTQLGLNLAWSDQKTIPSDESLSQFSINPSISWELGEDLNARIGYSYRQRDGNDSHRLDFSIATSLERGL